MMTLSEIKREIRSLQRKYHKEIAIYRLRRASEEVYNDYARAVGDRQDPPKPLEIIRRIADQGFRLTTWMHLHNYLDKVREQGDIPEPRRIVLALLPWAWKSKYDHYLTRELPPPDPKPDLGLLWAQWFSLTGQSRPS